MSKTISVGQLASEVVSQLEKYADLCTEDMKKAVKDSAATVRKEISATAPVRTGKYAKSWAASKVNETATTLEMTVHSKNRYQLAHLLEFGHAKRNGGRTKAIAHIAPAEALGIKQLEEQIERSIANE